MYDRRAFLKKVGLATAALAYAEDALAEILLPLEYPPSRFVPIRIRGRVTVTGRGRGGVAVSDGLSVVQTADDGTFEMISSSQMRFVHVSIPPGCTIPTNPSGTALFYKPVSAGSSGEMTAVFELEQAPVHDESHAFIVLADPQVLDGEDVAQLLAAAPDVRAAVRQLSPLPVFGVACGDIMYDALDLIPDYKKAVHEIGTPFFQVVGNHDVDVLAQTDEASVRTFEHSFGPTYYSFDRGDVHYIVLDDVFWFGDYIGYLDQQQLDWMKSDLALVERGRTVVVFVHIPPITTLHLRHGRTRPSNTASITNRALLYRLLEPYESYVVSGHMHEMEFIEHGGAQIHVCGTLCGAWWTGPICHDGTPSGYTIYRVNGGGVSWQYKPTGMGVENQMRLYPPGANREAPTSVTANVWAADQHWTVAWYEDGMKKGRMQRRVGMDPLSVELHRGSDRPGKHPWVEPVNTDHLFYGEPSPGAGDIVVEATDRWGRVYTERLTI